MNPFSRNRINLKIKPNRGKKATAVKSPPVSRKINTVNVKKWDNFQKRNIKNKYKVKPQKNKTTVTLDNFKLLCKGKSVLIVGNSCDIIDNYYGDIIDSYDVVVRINYGYPIPKYYKNMGEKMTIWAHGILNKRKQIQIYRDIRKKVKYHIETNQRKLCRQIFDEKAFLIPNDWYKKKYESINRCEMSTGLNTLIFFTDYVQTYNYISIVGFDFLRTSNKALGSKSSKQHKSDIEEKEAIEYLERCKKYVPFNNKYNIV